MRISRICSPGAALPVMSPEKKSAPRLSHHPVIDPSALARIFRLTPCLSAIFSRLPAPCHVPVTLTASKFVAESHADTTRSTAATRDNRCQSRIVFRPRPGGVLTRERVCILRSGEGSGQVAQGSGTSPGMRVWESAAAQRECIQRWPQGCAACQLGSLAPSGAERLGVEEQGASGEGHSPHRVPRGAGSRVPDLAPRTVSDGGSRGVVPCLSARSQPGMA